MAVAHILAGIRDKRSPEEPLMPLDAWPDPTPDGELEPAVAADERAAGMRLDW